MSSARSLLATSKIVQPWIPNFKITASKIL